MTDLVCKKKYKIVATQKCYTKPTLTELFADLKVEI